MPTHVFLIVLTSVIALSLPAQAQQPAKVPRIGYRVAFPLPQKPRAAMRSTRGCAS